MYYMLHTAARLMYYMTGTDRRCSNHGGSSLMLLPVAAAGLYQVTHSSKWSSLYAEKWLQANHCKLKLISIHSSANGGQHISQHRGSCFREEYGGGLVAHQRVRWCRCWCIPLFGFLPELFLDFFLIFFGDFWIRYRIWWLLIRE